MPHDPLHQVLHAARSRRRLRAIVRSVSAGAVAGLAAALAVVIWHRLTQPAWSLPIVLGTCTLAGPLVGLLHALLVRRPDELGAAIELERHHHLKERLSSALFAERASERECPPELAALVVADGRAHARTVDVARAVPIGTPRSARAALALALLVGLTWWAIPPLDLLGREEDRTQVEREEKRIEEKDRRLRERMARLEEVAERHPVSPETKRLIADLQKPRELPRTEKPKEAVRRPLADLEELKKRAEALRDRKEMSGLDQLVRTMQGIDERMETPEGERARRAMSEGSPQRASEAMNELAKKLAEAGATMSESEKRAISRDLEKLAEALSKMPELSDDLLKALSQMEAGDMAGAAKGLGKNAADLERLARLMREKNLLDQVAQEIEFTQDELAQLPTEWRTGPPPEICPDCLKGT